MGGRVGRRGGFVEVHPEGRELLVVGLEAEPQRGRVEEPGGGERGRRGRVERLCREGWLRDDGRGGDGELLGLVKAQRDRVVDVDLEHITRGRLRARAHALEGAHDRRDLVEGGERPRLVNVGHVCEEAREIGLGGAGRGVGRGERRERRRRQRARRARSSVGADDGSSAVTGMLPSARGSMDSTTSTSISSTTADTSRGVGVDGGATGARGNAGGRGTGGSGGRATPVGGVGGRAGAVGNARERTPWSWHGAAADAAARAPGGRPRGA